MYFLYLRGILFETILSSVDIAAYVLANEFEDDESFLLRTGYFSRNGKNSGSILLNDNISGLGFSLSFSVSSIVFISTVYLLDLLGISGAI